MICNNCGKANDSGSNFCKYCGNNVDPTANDPHRTIFENAYQAQPKSNVDLGYLIISILILINVFLWFFWGFIFGGADMSNNRMLYKAIRVISTIFSVAQFVVMFIFAKRQAYKIVIAINSSYRDALRSLLSYADPGRYKILAPVWLMKQKK